MSTTNTSDAGRIVQLENEVVHLRHEMGVLGSNLFRLELLVANRLGVDPPVHNQNSNSLVNSNPNPVVNSHSRQAEPDAQLGLFEGDKEVTEGKETDTPPTPVKKERKPRKNVKTSVPTA